MEESAIQKGDNVFRLFQMNIEEASKNYARVSMPITEITRNGMGFVHGGVLFSLADITFGAAANFGQKTGTVTTSSNMNYLVPATKGPIVAEAKCIRHGHHIVIYDVNVYDADKVLVCHGTFQGFRTDYSFSNIKP